MATTALPVISLSRPAAERRIAPIVAAVCEVFGVPPSALIGGRRLGDHVLARQVAMYLSAKRERLANKTVGRALRKHHTTVLHAKREIARRMEVDDELRRVVVAAEERLDAMLADAESARAAEAAVARARAEAELRARAEAGDELAANVIDLLAEVLGKGKP